MNVRNLLLATLFLVPVSNVSAFPDDTLFERISERVQDLREHIKENPKQAAQYTAATLAAGYGLYKFGWKVTLAAALVIAYRKKIAHYTRAAYEKLQERIQRYYDEKEKNSFPKPSAPPLEDLPPEPSAPALEDFDDAPFYGQFGK
jgi:hypothetical protein